MQVMVRSSGPTMQAKCLFQLLKLFSKTPKELFEKLQMIVEGRRRHWQSRSNHHSFQLYLLSLTGPSSCLNVSAYKSAVPACKQHGQIISTETAYKLPSEIICWA